MSISLYSQEDEKSWDRFVGEAPGATFFHLSGWKRVIENTFGHKTFYLLARNNGKIEGILPLTQVKSVLFGNLLISNAFCVQGGVVAENEEVRHALKEEAIRIARELKVSCVELRAPGTSALPWQTKTGLYFTFRRALLPHPDANMKALPRERRRLIRVATANGLTSVLDEGVERLHDIYAQSVRQLGTPVFSRRYFQALKREFGPACDILTVMHESRPIASVMNFYFRDEVLPYYGGGLTEARTLAGNDFMYWEVMRRASERGARIFDFGRSKIGTGAYSFKRNWGFEPAPLDYEYFPLKANQIPDNNPLNPRYRLAISLWQRLPLSITKLIGPAIVRSIG